MHAAQQDTDPTTRRIPTPSDIVEILMLIVLLLPAWLLPECAWGIIARFLGRLLMAIRPGQMHAKRLVIAQGLAALGVNRSAWDVQWRLVSATFERYFQLLREYAPWRWHPAIQVDGLESVSAALAAGRGALLYVYPTIFYNLVGKKGIAGTGIKVVHLGRISHGFSGSPFAMRYLSPLLFRAENRYIDRRLMLEEGAAVRSLRPLVKVLASNGVVTITAVADGRSYMVPFLGGSLRLARGAASISLTSRAALIPVMVVRESTRHYRIVFEQPLSSEPLTGDRDVDERRLLEVYAARLAPFVARYPEQFPQWHNPRRWHIEIGSTG